MHAESGSFTAKHLWDRHGQRFTGRSQCDVHKLLRGLQRCLGLDPLDTSPLLLLNRHDCIIAAAMLSSCMLIATGNARLEPRRKYTGKERTLSLRRLTRLCCTKSQICHWQMLMMMILCRLYKQVRKPPMRISFWLRTAECCINMLQQSAIDGWHATRHNNSCGLCTKLACLQCSMLQTLLGTD